MPDSSDTPGVEGPEGEFSHRDTREEATEVVRYAPEDQISLLELLSVLLKYRYLILVSTVVVAVVAAVHLIVTFSPTYTAAASFIPQQESQGGMSGLQAVAGRFGIDVPSSGGGRSLAFYEDILESREILRPILSDTFTVVSREEGSDGREKRGSLQEILDVEIEDPALREEAGIEWLRGVISTSTKPSTGVVSFSVKTPWSRLSEQIASSLLDQVNEFNLEARQSQAAAERRFIEERLEEVREELGTAERELRRFLEANRQFQNSPELVFEHQRLQRQVNMRQELYTSLAQAYEQARISEVRNTPVITVLEPPQNPVYRDPRGLKRRGLLGLALGAFVGISVAFGREYLSRTPEEGSEGYQKLRTAWQDVVDDIRRVLPGA